MIGFRNQGQQQGRNSLNATIELRIKCCLNKKGQITSNYQGLDGNYLRQRQQHNALIPSIRVSMMLTVITHVGVPLGASALTSGAVTTTMAPGRWGYSWYTSPTLEGKKTWGASEPARRSSGAAFWWLGAPEDRSFTMSPGAVQVPVWAAGSPNGAASNSVVGEVVEEEVTGGEWVVDDRCLKLDI